MNKFFILLWLLVASSAYGQVKTPNVSPKAEVEQMIGLTEVEIEYYRPHANGRKIFGDLIPFDELWRLGANKNSTISFSTDVVFGGVNVNKGEYAIYAKPSKNNWTIYLYGATDNWGLPREWKEELVVLMIEVPVTKSKKYSSNLTFSFNDLNILSGKLLITWENTMVEIPIEVPTVKIAMASIQEVMDSGNVSERDYYSAASFYLEVDRNLEMALSYIEKAIQLNENEIPPYWYTRKQAVIAHKLGKIDLAIDAAEMSLKAAQESGNDTYIKLNEASLKEWR